MMLEISKPKLDVETVIEQIQEEIEISQGLRINNLAENNSLLELSSTVEYVKVLIANAESFSETQIQWPNKLNFFPFNINIVQNFILKIYSFILKKQRMVNLSLIGALKASLAVNEQLIFQVNSLVQSLHSLKEQSSLDKQNLLNIEQGLSKTEQNRHLLDAFYVAFEDRFRGTREEILHKLQVYLPLIKDANIGTNNAPILDVGCGRGEWLELLQNNGYQAQGIDINRVMVERCQKKGLKVIEKDALEYVKSLPDQSLGGITGFHIIEHLPFEILIQLFSETVRVLKTGGIAIFETPNPDNVLVGSNKFYRDPTHLHPLPSEFVKFIAESQGLSKVQILPLNPDSENLLFKGSEIAERFNQHFYSEQDYSVIGYKA